MQGIDSTDAVTRDGRRGLVRVAAIFSGQGTMGHLFILTILVVIRLNEHRESSRLPSQIRFYVPTALKQSTFHLLIFESIKCTYDCLILGRQFLKNVHLVYISQVWFLGWQID